LQQQTNILNNTDSLTYSNFESDSLIQYYDSIANVDAILQDTVVNQAAEPEVLENFFHTPFDSSFSFIDSSISLGIGQLAIILSVTLMLGFLKLLFEREALIVVLSPFKTNGFRKLQEEDSLTLKRSVLLMAFIHVFVISVFIYEIFNYLDVHFSLIPNVPFFLEVFILVGIIASFRFLISKLLGHIFDLEQLAADYNHRLLIINCLTGLILLPFMLGLRLAPESLVPIFAWTGIGVLLVLYSVGLAVGADLGWHSERISKYHLFLYFCTLEIAPFIVLFKALSSLN